ncbi:MAG: hypothetical protein U0L14_03745, partial [Bifidobacterium ruminantium]|nr:hypothetical protein [Bifidobacterium ruminantium]
MQRILQRKSATEYCNENRVQKPSQCNENRLRAHAGRVTRAAGRTQATGSTSSRGTSGNTNINRTARDTTARDSTSRTDTAPTAHHRGTGHLPMPDQPRTPPQAGQPHKRTANNQHQQPDNHSRHSRHLPRLVVLRGVRDLRVRNPMA